MKIMIGAATAILTAAAGISVPEFLGGGRSSGPVGAAGAKIAGDKVEKPPSGEAKAAEGNAPAGPNEGKPAPVNPYNGMQEREEVFEFTERPKVEKQGDKWVISFASRGKCDATLWAEAPDGRVVAHIASGVLGANAPYPFRQNSLSQKIEWDGKDDMGRPAPAGCKVKVGLGLKASYERVLAWDPHAWAGKREALKHAVFSDGTICVVGNDQVRLYGADGKYLRTLAPHPANLGKDKLDGFTWIKTIYGGEEVPVPIGRGWRDNFHDFMGRGISWSADPAARQVIMTVSDNKKGAKHYAIGADGSFKVAAGPGPAKLADGPGKIAAAAAAPEATYAAAPRIEADPFRDEVYVRWDSSGHVCSKGIARYDGKTGALDKTWPDIGMDMMDFGPDGLLYARIGSYGKHVARFDRFGKVVSFLKGVMPKKGYYELPDYLNKYNDPFTVISYGTGGSNVQQKGFAVSPANGDIYVHIQYVDPGWAAANCKEWKKDMALIAVFAPDGSLKCANAIPGVPATSHGLRVDRWNNVYKGVNDHVPAGQKLFEGLAAQPPGRPGWGEMPAAGAIVKFRGGSFPVGAFKDLKENAAGVKLDLFRANGGCVAEGALWAYGGVSPLGGSACSCPHSLFDVDPYGRSFLPQAYTFSVVVLDGNGNKVLRIGRYGNADSQGPKSAVPEPEIGFAWVRGVSATDRALYALDYGNRRILKARLSYAAEETVPVP